MIEKIFSRKRVTAFLAAVAVALSCLTGVVPVGGSVEAVYIEMTVNDNDYPYAEGQAPSYANSDNWGFVICQCTSFVAWRINDRHKIDFNNKYKRQTWGDAKNWKSAAEAAGIRVDMNPAVGSIWWTNSGFYGHVAWVTKVEGNTVTIEEFNYGTDKNPTYYNRYHSRTMDKDYGVSGYIHFEDLATPVEKGTELTSGAGQTIPDGDYYIACWDENKRDYIMTIAGMYSGSEFKGCDGATVQLYASYGDPVHIFHFEYVGQGGFYKITSPASAKSTLPDRYGAEQSLDVKDGRDGGIYAALQTRGYDGNPAQLWSVIPVDNGSGRYGLTGVTYRIRSKCNGYYIDLPGGEVKNDKHLQLYKKEEPTNEINEKAQNWRLIPCEAKITTKPTASAITYGQSLSDSILTGGKANVAGTFKWYDGTIKPTVIDSELSYLTVFTPTDTALKSVTCGVHVTVLPAEAPAGMPEGNITADSGVTKVGDIPLPENWAWNNADVNTEVGSTPVTATAVYTGEDGGAGNYKKESVSVTITRSECTHPENKREIRGKTQADCENDGYSGDTYCTECGALIEKGSTIAALGHDWGEWNFTVKPTEPAVGSAERVCGNNSEHKDTAVVPVLTDTSQVRKQAKKYSNAPFAER